MNATPTQTPVFMFTDLPKEKDQIANFCGDGESDSLSMHLSDVDSVFSINGEQFFEEEEFTNTDTDCAEVSNSPQNNTYDCRQLSAAPESSFDFDPIMISSLTSAISKLPDSVPSVPTPRFARERNYCYGTHVPARKYTSENFSNVSSNASYPHFIHENNNYGTYTPSTQLHFIPESTPSPEAIRFNRFKAAIARSKKTHEDLLQWDRSNGVKKGFSRTMSKTKNSRVLVQSVLGGKKRNLGPKAMKKTMKNQTSKKRRINKVFNVVSF